MTNTPYGKFQTGRDRIVVWLFGILPLLIALTLGLIGLLRRL
jgi:quinol-cytochrome oxidoreductase complex cytochrome b subunit